MKTRLFTGGVPTDYGLSFVFWIIFNGGIDYVYPLTMCIGSAIGAFVGPWVTL